MTQVDIPPKFWGTLSPKEKTDIFRAGHITGPVLDRLWKMLGHKDKCPDRLGVFVEQASLDRVIRKLKRQSSGRPLS